MISEPMEESVGIRGYAGTSKSDKAVTSVIYRSACLRWWTVVHNHLRSRRRRHKFAERTLVCILQRTIIRLYWFIFRDGSLREEHTFSMQSGQHRARDNRQRRQCSSTSECPPFPTPETHANQKARFGNFAESSASRSEGIDRIFQVLRNGWNS